MRIARLWVCSVLLKETAAMVMGAETPPTGTSENLLT
jgi:hypothetical protein